MCRPAIDAWVEELPVDVLAPGVDDMGKDIVFEEEALEVVEGLYDELLASNLTEATLARESGRGLPLSLLLLLLLLLLVESVGVNVVDGGGAWTF